jgi:hypothetical protein
MDELRKKAAEFISVILFLFRESIIKSKRRRRKLSRKNETWSFSDIFTLIIIFCSDKVMSYFF